MDVFVEQVVTRKNRALREVLFYGAWVLLVACALIGLSGLMNVLYTGADGGLAFRPLAAGMAVVFLSGAFLLWRAALRLRTEYDYSFTNGVIDVARVMNGRKRTYLTSFDVKELRAAGEENSPPPIPPAPGRTACSCTAGISTRKRRSSFFSLKRRAAGIWSSSS